MSRIIQLMHSEPSGSHVERAVLNEAWSSALSTFLLTEYMHRIRLSRARLDTLGGLVSSSRVYGGMVLKQSRVSFEATSKTVWYCTVE